MTTAFLEKYGNPDKNGDGVLDLEWAEREIRVFSLPFPLELSWGAHQMIFRFQAHRLAGDKIVRALCNVRDAVGAGFLREHGWDQWGGCFNFRLIRGGTELSVHSWGAAVDFNPHIGRLGNADDAKTYPSFIVASFEAEGFVWGGLWPRPDAMHFELKE